MATTAQATAADLLNRQFLEHVLVHRRLAGSAIRFGQCTNVKLLGHNSVPCMCPFKVDIAQTDRQVQIQLQEQDCK